MFTLISLDVTSKAFKDKGDIGIGWMVATSLCMLLDLVFIRFLYNIG